MPRRALVFDYDGLMVDTETCEYLVWKKVFEDHGQRLEVADWAHIVGTADLVQLYKELEVLSGAALDRERVERERVEHYHRLFEGMQLLPGVRALFDQAQAQGWAIGVASNSTVAWVSKGLERYGLASRVQALRGRDTAARPKPHPDPYLEVLAELGAEPTLSYAFEDSATGVTAARAAGMRVVAVPNDLTRGHDLSRAHVVLESLEQFRLPAVVEGA